MCSSCFCSAVLRVSQSMDWRPPTTSTANGSDTSCVWSRVLSKGISGLAELEPCVLPGKTGSATETFAKEMIVTRTTTKTLFIIKLHRQQAFNAARARDAPPFGPIVQSFENGDLRTSGLFPRRLRVLDGGKRGWKTQHNRPSASALHLHQSIWLQVPSFPRARPRMCRRAVWVAALNLIEAHGGRTPGPTSP
jgi:hypothetical protein